MKVEPQRHLLSRILPAVGATALVFRIASLALGVWFIVGYLAVARFRIPYPFELEWLEAASLEHVRRVRFGEPLYVPPSVDFIPLIYTPLFYWISAALSWITGIGLHTLRLVSFLSSLGVLFVIFRLVSKETASFSCALLAASLFAASFASRAPDESRCRLWRRERHLVRPRVLLAKPTHRLHGMQIGKTA